MSKIDTHTVVKIGDEVYTIETKLFQSIQAKAINYKSRRLQKQVRELKESLDALENSMSEVEDEWFNHNKIIADGIRKMIDTLRRENLGVWEYMPDIKWVLDDIIEYADKLENKDEQL